MTDREPAAFRAGLKHAADMALISALAIELRDDAGEVRQRAAIEALRGLAEGLKASTQPAPSEGALRRIMGAIAADSASAGTEECPHCAGRLAWIKDRSNGHVHARYEGMGCIAVMQ